MKLKENNNGTQWNERRKETKDKKLNYQKYILFQVKLEGKTAVLKTAHQKSQGNEKTENVESSPSIKKKHNGTEN